MYKTTRLGGTVPCSVWGPEFRSPALTWKARYSFWSVTAALGGRDRQTPQADWPSVEVIGELWVPSEILCPKSKIERRERRHRTSPVASTPMHVHVYAHSNAQVHTHGSMNTHVPHKQKFSNVIEFFRSDHGNFLYNSLNMCEYVWREGGWMLVGKGDVCFQTWLSVCHRVGFLITFKQINVFGTRLAMAFFYSL